MGKRRNYDGIVWYNKGWERKCPTCSKLVNHGEAKESCRTSAWKGADCMSCSNSKNKLGTGSGIGKYIAGANPWVKRIKARDKCCQVCGNANNLEAHHIFARAYWPTLAVSDNNGITLCNACHKEFHTLNGKSQFKLTIQSKTERTNRCQ